jgi:hypothetical protein
MAQKVKNVRQKHTQSERMWGLTDRVCTDTVGSRAVYAGRVKGGLFSCS